MDPSGLRISLARVLDMPQSKVRVIHTYKVWLSIVDKCKMADSRIYSSPVAYALAKGIPTSKEMVAHCPKRCDGCKVAFKDSKCCDTCKVGFVGDRMFENEEDHRVALAAYQTLEKANFVAEGICEDCAVAMVNDGRCDKCNVSFKDGRFADGSCAKKGQSAGEKPKGNRDKCRDGKRDKFVLVATSGLSWDEWWAPARGGRWTRRTTGPVSSVCSFRGSALGVRMQVQLESQVSLRRKKQ